MTTILPILGAYQISKFTVAGEPVDGSSLRELKAALRAETLPAKAVYSQRGEEVSLWGTVHLDRSGNLAFDVDDKNFSCRCFVSLAGKTLRLTVKQLEMK